jgi:hypothetical protein
MYAPTQKLANIDRDSNIIGKSLGTKRCHLAQLDHNRFIDHLADLPMLVANTTHIVFRLILDLARSTRFFFVMFHLYGLRVYDSWMCTPLLFPINFFFFVLSCIAKRLFLIPLFTIPFFYQLIYSIARCLGQLPVSYIGITSRSLLADFCVIGFSAARMLLCYCSFIQLKMVV